MYSKVYSKVCGGVRRKFLLLLTLVSGPAVLAARENNVTAKFRTGYFLLTSDLMQKEFRHGGADFEGEFSARFYEDLNFWVNFNIFRRDGKTLGYCNPASLHVYPLSAGFIYAIAPDSPVFPYVGIGGSFSFIKIEGENPTLKHYLDEGVWGVVGKSGLAIALSEHYFIDLFADYYYTRPCHTKTASQVGGIRVGVGIGCNF
jgi:hypothetical protein